MRRFIQLLLPVLLAFSLLAGCAPSQATPSSTVSSATAASAQPKPGETSAAPGATIALQNPAQGLEGLKAYRATLAVRFEGTPQSWSQNYDLSADTGRMLRGLGYKETGLKGPAQLPWWEATLGDVHYLRAQEGQACAAGFLSTDGGATPLIEPAAVLPPLKALAAAGGPQEINGATAQGYEVRAGEAPGQSSAKVSGKVWIATAGGYVSKYQLSLQGGEDVFGAGQSGTMTWDYQVQAVDPSNDALLPADCPLPLPEIPLVDDASEVLRMPGLISYQTARSLDDAAAFYQEAMESAGFTAEGEGSLGTTHATLRYLKDDSRVVIRLSGGEKTQVDISREGSQAASAPTRLPTPTVDAATAASTNATLRVSRALNLLTGSEQTPSVFQSYHLESKDQAPAWVNGTAGQKTEEYSADVAGKNVHFTYRSGQNANEYYLIGAAEYEVKDGKVADSMGAAVSWAFWPLNPVIVLGIGSLKVEAAGTEAVEGRTAEVYTLKGTLADDPTGMFAGFGLPITQNEGKAWIDAETGALLKLVADYKAEIKDSDGNVLGQGSGHLEVTVTKVNQVSVALP
jgi:hypothetical protein